MTPHFRSFLGMAGFITFLVLLLVLSINRAHAAPDDTDEFVTGVLAVPFKWHLSDKAVTAGSTVGGYVGYQTKTYHDLTLTPIVGGGLALISQSNVSAPATALGTGVSIASGLIGRIGSPGTQGVQVGVILGCDWLGRGADYRYEGKPWLAFEVGYNFSL